MTATASQSLPTDAALRQAIAHHQVGRWHEAEHLYRAILQVQPNQPTANHNLGMLAGQMGRHAAGLPYLKAALEVNPAKEQYWLSYIAALLASGFVKEALNIIQAALQRGYDTQAIQSLRRQAEAVVLNHLENGNEPTVVECSRLSSLFSAREYVELESRARLLIDKYPDSGFVWKALGLSLQMQGKDALPALRKATELLPSDAEAHCNLGNALRDAKQLDDALASCHRAIEIKPDFAMAHNNLGNVLQELGRLNDAVSSYRRAVKIKPDFAEAHSNLGDAMRHLGQFENAVASCHRALAIKPDFAMAHGNMGNVLRDLGKLDDAVACYRRALEIEPAFAEAHYRLGNALRDLGQLDNALASYRKALEIKPDFAVAHINLGNILADLGQLDDAINAYRRSLEIKPDFAVALNNLLLAHCYRSDQSAAISLAEARYFGDLVEKQARPYKSWRNAPDPARCLRVGLVSGDLRQHPVGDFIKGVLAELFAQATDRLEVHAYYNHSFADAVTGQIRDCCHGWHSVVGLSDEALAQRIHDDNIDILLDLSGHTANNRLPMFAWKPAPVQCTWLGYLATTGVSAIDYLIADLFTLPETEEKHFTEKIWRLPETYLCFTPPDTDMPVAPLPALANGYITFGCFNNLTKLSNEAVALWAKILQKTPGSRLILKARQLREVSVQQGIMDRFAAHGIGFERIVLKGSVPQAEYLAPYQQVDIALDPFPYPGITTSIESLWMGVPVLTLAGDSFLSRQGVGILTNIGMHEWIATNADDYVARAISHARDLQRLADMRNGLRQRVLASPIIDAPRFARNFETALRGMWTQWCNRQQGSP